MKRTSYSQIESITQAPNFTQNHEPLNVDLIETSIVDSITLQEMIFQPIPISKLLDRSCYYPSCSFDGLIIKNLSENIQSFIFCNYGISEDEVIENLNSFHGYRIVGSRAVELEELFPSGWEMKIPPNLELVGFISFDEYIKKPFAYWTVYERLADFDESIGSKRFSIVYIGGDDVAIYQALYWSNEKSASILALIEPDTSFGSNKSNTYRKNQFMMHIILQDFFGAPPVIFAKNLSIEI